MKIPREIVCLSIVVLIVAGWIADLSTAKKHYLGKGTLIVTSVGEVCVWHDERCVRLEQIDYGHSYRSGDPVRLYEIRGVFGRFGWCVTKEGEP